MTTEESTCPIPEDIDQKFKDLLYDLDYPEEKIEEMMQQPVEIKMEFIERDELADQSIQPPAYHVEKLNEGLSEEHLKGLKILLTTCKISWIKSFLEQEGLKMLISRLCDFQQECMLSILTPIRIKMLKDLVKSIRILANVRIAREEFSEHPEYVGPIIAVYYPQEVELMSDLLAITTVFSNADNFPRYVLDHIEALRRQRLHGWEIIGDFLVNATAIAKSQMYSVKEAEKIKIDAFKAFFAFINCVIYATKDNKSYCQLILDLQKSQIIAHLKTLREYLDESKSLIDDGRLLKQMFPKEGLNPFDVRQVTDFVNESIDDDRKMAINLHLANLIQTSPDNSNRVFEYIENFLLIYRQLIANGKQDRIEEAAYFALHPFEYPELSLPSFFADVFDKYGFLPNGILQEVPLPAVFNSHVENESATSLKVKLTGVQEELKVLRDHIKRTSNENQTAESQNAEMKKLIEDLQERAIPETDRIKKLKAKVEEKKKELEEYKKFKSISESKTKEVEKLRKEIKELREMRRMSTHDEPEVPESKSAPVLSGPPPPPPPPPPGPSACPIPPLPPGKRPKNKMRGFFWTKINQQDAKGTIWDDLDDSDPDTTSLEKEFALKPAPEKSSILIEKKKEEANKIVELLDPNRARSINIMLSRIKLNFVDIASAIMQLRYNDVFTDDQFTSLFACRPKPEEMKIVCEYDGDRSQLGDPEKYFLALSRINMLDAHLNFMNIQHNFSDLMRSISEPLFTLKYALYSIKTSDRLRKVLSVIRTFGNFMNSGTLRGAAAGFKIGTLPTLIDIRGATPHVTFLHVLVNSVLDKDESMVYEDFKDLSAAAKIDVEVLRQSLHELVMHMDSFREAKIALKQNVADGDLFYPKMEEFEPDAMLQIEHASAMLKEVDDLYKDCLDFFCENSKDYTMMSFIDVFANFGNQFQYVREDIMKKLEQERQKQIKKEKETLTLHGKQRGCLDADLDMATSITKSQEMLIKKTNTKGNRLSIRMASCSLFKLA